MPSFKLFALDDWVRKYRSICKTTLHNSCLEPLTLAQLQSLDPSRPILEEHTPLTYGPTRGLPELREKIASLYSKDAGIDTEDILITSGAIAANYLVLETVISASDHVIVQHPTYNQLVEIPRRLGAEVELWKWQHSADLGKWTVDLEELTALIRPNTKMIILTNPSNPTGAETSSLELQRIIHLARANNILVMSDEVFRPLHHSVSSPIPPSLLELDYPNAMVTGSVSKAYALPGVRVGWVAASPTLRETLLEQVARTRDYTSITVSGVDQQIASFALTPSVRGKLLERSAEICQRNLGVLDAWAERNRDWVCYVPPAGGGTCVVQIRDKRGEVVDDVGFADALAREEGVLVPPAGKCFGDLADGSGGTGLKGWLRVGVVTADETVKEGLEAIERVRGRWGGG